MRKGCCILAFLGVALAACPGFIFFCQSAYYGEAEPLADRLVIISRHLSSLRNQNQKMPATVQEILQFLPEEDRKRFEGRTIIWQPEAEPMLKMRANQKYGFVIDQECRFRWVDTAEEMKALFPGAP